MTDLHDTPAPRKLLSLKKQRKDAEERIGGEPSFVNKNEAVYMVWCAGGDMPKRVYQANEQELARSHARMLAREHQRRFYVMRAWRGLEPEAE